MKTKINYEGLTALQKGILDKALDKQYRFGELGIKTYRELIQSDFFTSKETRRGGMFNRTHYNRLDYAEQEAYEKRLAENVTYRLFTEDGSFYEVPKIIYDSFELVTETVNDSLVVNDSDRIQRVTASYLNNAELISNIKKDFIENLGEDCFSVEDIEEFLQDDLNVYRNYLNGDTELLSNEETSSLIQALAKKVYNQ